MSSTASQPRPTPPSTPVPAHSTSPTGGAAPEPWGWTPAHRITLVVLLSAALVFMIVQYARRPARLDDPIVLHEGHVVELEQRLDPNKADWPSLARIPHMTEKASQAIVSYRESHRVGEDPVFETAEDLLQVPLANRHLSRKFVEEVQPFLLFPKEPATPARRGLAPPKLVPETRPDAATDDIVE